MRIGLVIYGALSQRTGGYLYDRMLVAGLRRLGAEVEVIRLPDGWYGGRLLQNLAQGARRRRLDVVLQDELCHPSLWLANRWRRCPVVAIVHNLGAERSAARWVERRRRFDQARLGARSHRAL